MNNKRHASGTLRAAIVGVGQADGKGSPTGGSYRIGYVHAAAYNRSDRFELVSAADINARNLEVFRDKFAVADGHSSLQAMLDAVRPDVVSICTYVGLHLSMLEACANAGVKGVICEKPLVASPAELAQLHDLVESTGVRIVVPHFRRYLPAFVLARDVYASGEIGDPVIVAAAIGDDWDLSEWGSHWLDMFRFFHGDAMPDWVMGQARVRGRRGFGHAMEDHAQVLMRFPDGGRALLETGPLYLNGGANMALTGSRGSIVIRAEDDVTVYSSHGERNYNFAAEADLICTWSRMFDALADWIEDGTVAPLGFPHVSGTAALNLASYLSMVDGDRIDFPLQSTFGEWPVEELARRRHIGSQTS